MSQSNQNPTGPRKATNALGEASRDPLDVPAPERPVDDDMLMEATDALVRAISQQDSGTDEATAVARALQGEVLALFDAPAVNQAIDFLHRLGFLSAPAVRRARGSGEGGPQAGQQRRAA